MSKLVWVFVTFNMVAGHIIKLSFFSAGVRPFASQRGASQLKYPIFGLFSKRSLLRVSYSNLMPVGEN